MGVMDTYIKKLTHCGNPDLLPLADYGIVPQVFPDLPEGYRHSTTYTVYADRVEMGIEPIPAPTPLEQIATLESSITPRMMREALLGKNDVNPHTGKTAKQQIQAIDDQIAALRGN